MLLLLAQSTQRFLCTGCFIGTDRMKRSLTKFESCYAKSKALPVTGSGDP
jgi:hypothetical protein